MVRLKRERGQKFGAGQVIDILLGKQTDKVSQHRHDSLSVFGVGKDLTDLQWRAVVRQLLAQGVLAVEGDYGTLLSTPAGDEVLYRGRQIRLRDDPVRVPQAKPAKASRGRPPPPPSFPRRMRRCSSSFARGAARQRRNRACPRT